MHALPSDSSIISTTSHGNNTFKKLWSPIYSSSLDTLLHSLVIPISLDLLPTARQPSCSVKISQRVSLLRPWHQRIRTGRLLALFKLSAHLRIHYQANVRF